MAKRKVTNLTDVSEITCVVQKGMADEIVQSLLDAGIQGATVHSGVGTGIRERMGLLGVAVEVEREIVIKQEDVYEVQPIQVAVLVH